MEYGVITIGRQLGSGGRDIGVSLSEKLGIKCYDKELLSLAAKRSGFAEEILENNDEKPTKSFLYSLVMDTNAIWGYSNNSYLEMPLNQKVFLAQFDAIKELAPTLDRISADVGDHLLHAFVACLDLTTGRCIDH